MIAFGQVQGLASEAIDSDIDANRQKVAGLHQKLASIARQHPNPRPDPDGNRTRAKDPYESQM